MLGFKKKSNNVPITATARDRSRERLRKRLIEDNTPSNWHKYVWELHQPEHNPSFGRVSVKSHEEGGEMTSDLSMRCFHYGFHDSSNTLWPAFINHCSLHLFCCKLKSLGLNTMYPLHVCCYLMTITSNSHKKSQFSNYLRYRLARADTAT